MNKQTQIYRYKFRGVQSALILSLIFTMAGSNRLHTGDNLFYIFESFFLAIVTALGACAYALKKKRLLKKPVNNSKEIELILLAPIFGYLTLYLFANNIFWWLEMSPIMIVALTWTSLAYMLCTE